jgi:glycosyltransferase involved in cell wall biosynthesis
MPGFKMRRRVSILSYTATGNALGRAWVFAELLADDFDVELVASCRPTDQVWAPLRSQLAISRRWFVRTLPGFHLAARSIARELVQGDLIIAVKPRLQTLGLALAAKAVRPRPVLLDIDDWEVGFHSPWMDALCAPVSWLAASSNLHTRWYSARASSADAITVSSAFLQSKFGGTWLPHARRAGLEPNRELAGPPSVIFAGTPRLHKGLQDLIQAFARVTLPGASLRIVGADGDEALRRLAATDSRISLLPPVPISELPGLLATAWLVVIPQRQTQVGVAQLPAKLMDAMASGKAVLSTAVGDIPRWLADDAGVIVPPNDPERLGDAMQQLLANPERLLQLGRNARRRFDEIGSCDAVRSRLLALVEALLAGKGVPPAPQLLTSAGQP